MIDAIEIQTNLSEYPKDGAILSPIEGEWLSFGDMHGNALKLLHIMIVSGAATVQKADYHAFAKIYSIDNETWQELPAADAQKILNQLEQIIHKIIIHPQVKLRLLGDLLCDRGINDYFTLLLIEKFTENNHETHLEIILSNHDVEFSERHQDEKKGYNRYRNENSKHMGTANPSQMRSLAGMHSFLLMGFITQARVNSLYNHYKKCIKLISYDALSMDTFGTAFLPIFTHTRANGLHIFLAGLCLLEPVNKELVLSFLGLPENKLSKIQEIIDTVKTTHEVNADQLMLIIDTLNDLARLSYALNKITDFLTMRFHGESVHGFSPSTYKAYFSLRFFTCHRNSIQENLHSSACLSGINQPIKIFPTCFTHGHLGPEAFPSCHCVNLDTLSGKGDKSEHFPILCLRTKNVESTYTYTIPRSTKSVEAPATESTWFSCFRCFYKTEKTIQPISDQSNTEKPMLF